MRRGDATDFFEEFVASPERQQSAHLGPQGANASDTSQPGSNAGELDPPGGERRRPSRWWLGFAALVAITIGAAGAVVVLDATPRDPTAGTATEPGSGTPGTIGSTGDTPGATPPTASEPTGEAAVALSLEGQRLLLVGSVPSEEVRDSLFVAVSQLLHGDLPVDNRLEVDPGSGTDVQISIGVIDSVLFDMSSAAISDEFGELLGGLASAAELVPEARIRVVGHTDVTGNDEINDILSLARAQAVVDYLIGEGVAATRLEAVGRGSREPVADNATPEGRQANRRIEIEIVM